MPPIRLVQTGESRQAGAANDADFEARVGAGGRFTVEGGGYVTRGRRTGRLSRRERAALARLAGVVDTRAAHSAKGAHRSALDLGTTCVVWAGPPPTDALRSLVGALAAPGAG